MNDPDPTRQEELHTVLGSLDKRVSWLTVAVVMMALAVFLQAAYVFGFRCSTAACRSVPPCWDSLADSLAAGLFGEGRKSVSSKCWSPAFGRSRAGESPCPAA